MGWGGGEKMYYTSNSESGWEIILKVGTCVSPKNGYEKNNSKSGGTVT